METVGQSVGREKKGNKQAIKGKHSWKNEEMKIWIIHSYLMYEEDQYTVAYVGLVVSCTLLLLPLLFPLLSPTEFFKPLISPILSLHTQRAVSLGGRRLRGRDDPRTSFLHDARVSLWISDRSLCQYFSSPAVFHICGLPHIFVRYIWAIISHWLKLFSTLSLFVDAFH